MSLLNQSRAGAPAARSRPSTAPKRSSSAPTQPCSNQSPGSARRHSSATPSSPHPTMQPATSSSPWCSRCLPHSGCQTVASPSGMTSRLRLNRGDRAEQFRGGSPERHQRFTIIRNPTIEHALGWFRWRDARRTGRRAPRARSLPSACRHSPARCRYGASARRPPARQRQ